MKVSELTARPMAKKHLAELKILCREIAALEGRIEQLNAQLIPYGPRAREIDLQICQAQSELNTKSRRARKLADKYQVSEKLADIVKDPARSARHLWPKSRKDTHGL